MIVVCKSACVGGVGGVGGAAGSLEAARSAAAVWACCQHNKHTTPHSSLSHLEAARDDRAGVVENDVAQRVGQLGGGRALQPLLQPVRHDVRSRRSETLPKAVCVLKRA